MEEFPAHLTTSVIVFDKQDMRVAHPAGVHICALFPTIGVLSTRVGRVQFLGRQGIRDVVHMLAVHGIYAVRRPDGIDDRIKLAIHLRKPHGGTGPRRRGRAYGAISRSIVQRRGRDDGRILARVAQGVQPVEIELYLRVHVI